MNERRRLMVELLKKHGILTDRAFEKAMLKVPRELFVHEKYVSSAYSDEPLPIPPFDGMHTISAPHTYPIFCQALKLKKGDRFLEIGTGSGYGSALAAEIAGSRNVTTMESVKETFEFAISNLRIAGYKVHAVLGDGSTGHASGAPYDKIAVTASSPVIPKPLLDQLAPGGSMVFPQGPRLPSQDLLLVEKDTKGKVTESFITSVVYVPLIGKRAIY